jgi:3'-5' exoribonuclease
MNYEAFSPYVTSIEASPLFHLARVPLLNPLFYRTPAALKHHHAYTGGLAVHTKEVLDYGLAIGAQFPAFNRDVFITAALWHDYAKTVEYVEAEDLSEQDREMLSRCGLDWRRSGLPEATHGHILTGAQWCYYHARQHGVLASDRDAVIHCILSHHGRKDWGSPVEPATLEATILHHADLMSAKFGATKEVAP